MTIDVLLSTYNGSRFVDEQIASVLEQTYPDIRLIIRDDGSKDETPQKLIAWQKRHPEKITLYLESNVGVIESFNKLYTYSSAPFLAFCDQDDYWLPHKLETCFHLIDKQKPSLVHSDLKVVDADLQEMHPSFWDYSYLSGDLKYAVLSRLLIQNVVTGCATLMNRPLADIAFPVPKEAIMHDWWIALAASAFGSLISTDQPLIHYRQHGNNTVGAKPFTLLQKRNFHRLLNAARHEKKKINQAEMFLDRFHPFLTEEQKELLNAFLTLKDQRGFSRMKTIMRYHFYKIGWQRNLFHFIKIRMNGGFYGFANRKWK